VVVVDVSVTMTLVHERLVEVTTLSCSTTEVAVEVAFDPGIVVVETTVVLTVSWAWVVVSDTVTVVVHELVLEVEVELGVVLVVFHASIVNGSSPSRC
jgi:hypothetical protein